MKIVVCIKQVPETNKVSWNKKTGTLNREGVKSIINPEDKNALEQAIQLKEKYGATVTAITMGPPQAKEALIEAYGMGADEIILLTDRAFAGADTLATAYALSKAVQKIGEYDLILCGRQAIDGDTAQVGPQLAEFLDIPQVTYSLNVEVKDSALVIEKEIEEGKAMIKCSMPALVTVLGKANEPRYASAKNIVKIFKDLSQIKEWTAQDLNITDYTKIGLEGSPTKVYKSFVPKKNANIELYKGAPKEVVSQVVEKLSDKKLV